MFILVVTPKRLNNGESREASISPSYLSVFSNLLQSSYQALCETAICRLACREPNRRTRFRHINSDGGSIARAPVLTVLLSTHVSDVAKIISEQNIGAVIVARDFEPLGIIT